MAGVSFNFSSLSAKRQADDQVVMACTLGGGLLSELEMSMELLLLSIFLPIFRLLFVGFCFIGLGAGGIRWGEVHARKLLTWTGVVMVTHPMRVYNES